MGKVPLSAEEETQWLVEGREARTPEDLTQGGIFVQGSGWYRGSPFLRTPRELCPLKLSMALMQSMPEAPKSGL